MCALRGDSTLRRRIDRQELESRTEGLVSECSRPGERRKGSGEWRCRDSALDARGLFAVFNGVATLGVRSLLLGSMRSPLPSSYLVSTQRDSFTSHIEGGYIANQQRSDTLIRTPRCTRSSDCHIRLPASRRRGETLFDFSVPLQSSRSEQSVAGLTSRSKWTKWNIVDLILPRTQRSMGSRGQKWLLDGSGGL